MKDIIWDETHLKTLLLSIRFPLRLIREEPWSNWIEQRGGIKAIHEHLLKSELSTKQRGLLEVILQYPTEPAKFYANLLNISITTYFNNLSTLFPALLRELNGWEISENPPTTLSRLPQKESVPKFNNLPAELTSLCGVEEILDQLTDFLKHDDRRLVTLVGPGGIGKTRLGLAVATRLVNYFEHGVCFVPLATTRDPLFVCSAIARELGLRETPPQTLEITVAEYLSDKNMLLLLDNFEQVIQAIPLLVYLLENALELKIIVTSRASLRVYGEHVFEVLPLKLPDSQELPTPESLRQIPAVNLFLERVLTIAPDFKISKTNAADIAELCRCLEGLPLAIELAAARIKLFSPSAMLTQMRDPLAFLIHGPRNFPLHKQTLRDTLDWSYNLLEPGERLLFNRLSVFVGGASIEAIEAVCNSENDLPGGVLDGLSALLNQSLLQQDSEVKGEARFSMLEIIREYAAEHLEQSGEFSYVAECHFAYFKQIAKKFEPSLFTAEGEDNLAHLEVEHDNIRVMLNWILDQDRKEEALETIDALHQFWRLHGYLHEGIRWFERAFTYPNTLSTEGYLKAIPGFGLLLVTGGDSSRARKMYLEGLDLIRKQGDQKLLHKFLIILGITEMREQKYDQAREYFAQGLTSYREQYNEENDDQIGQYWLFLGIIASLTGDLEGAESLMKDSLNIFKQTGNKAFRGHCFLNLGNVAFQKGDYHSSRHLHQESLRIFQDLGDKQGSAYSLEALSVDAVGSGDKERGVRLWLEAKDLRLAIGAPLSNSDRVRHEKNLGDILQIPEISQRAQEWRNNLTHNDVILYALEPEEH